MMAMDLIVHRNTYENLLLLALGTNLLNTKARYYFKLGIRQWTQEFISERG